MIYRCKSINRQQNERTISLNVMFWRVLKPYIKKLVKMVQLSPGWKRTCLYAQRLGKRLNVCNRRDFPAYSVQATKHRQLCLVLTGFLTRHTPFPLLSTF